MSDPSPSELILAEIPEDVPFLIVAWSAGGDVEFRFTGASATATANILRQIAGDVVAKEQGSLGQTLQ